MSDDYGKISKYYNLLSCIYSLGAVGRCRESFFSELRPRMSVCFLGVGQGSEAVKAAELGAHVTVIDTSQSMLDNFRQKLELADAGAIIYHGDVVDFCNENKTMYDLVVSHFFLNVFAENKMPIVLDDMLDLCLPQGKIVIGDFWLEEKTSKYVQRLQKINWYLALFIFRIFAANSKHPIYVYDGLLEKSGFKVLKENTFNVLGIPMYRSIVALKSLG